MSQSAHTPATFAAGSCFTAHSVSKSGWERRDKATPQYACSQPLMTLRSASAIVSRHIAHVRSCASVSTPGFALAPSVCGAAGCASAHAPVHADSMTCRVRATLSARAQGSGDSRRETALALALGRARRSAFTTICLVPAFLSRI